MHPILRLDEVVKTYEQHTAVDHVSFEVPKGKIFGLLGPNGAGKTSLIRIITTITRADSGKVYLDGEELNSSHPMQIGYMPEERGLYKKMKVGELLLYLAQLKGMSYQEALQALRGWFTKFDIKEWWTKRVDELSKGMQQKIQFIATVVHRPKLLILDEPFSGLDPVNTNLIKDEIYQLSQEGTNIIFSTHRMEQVEEICEQIALIHQGKKILEGSVTDIKNTYKDNLFRINYTGELGSPLDSSFRLLEQKAGSLDVQLQPGQSANTLLQHVLGQGVQVQSFNEILPSLNEIFIKTVN